jgi:hypothetical protein
VSVLSPLFFLRGTVWPLASVFFFFNTRLTLYSVNSVMTWHGILLSFYPSVQSPSALLRAEELLSLHCGAHLQRNSLSLLGLWSRLVRRLVRFTPPFDV